MYDGRKEQHLCMIHVSCSRPIRSNSVNIHYTACVCVILGAGGGAVDLKEESGKKPVTRKREKFKLSLSIP